MNEAAVRCGRDPKEIQLCAATKMNDAAAVREAIAGGVDCCGENRVQELVAKEAENAYAGRPVHFIGVLQTNKVKQVVGHVDLIQSVDRRNLMAAIEKEAAKKYPERSKTILVIPAANAAFAIASPTAFAASILPPLVNFN